MYYISINIVYIDFHYIIIMKLCACSIFVHTVMKLNSKFVGMAAQKLSQASSNDADKEKQLNRAIRKLDQSSKEEKALLEKGLQLGIIGFLVRCSSFLCCR